MGQGTLGMWPVHEVNEYDMGCPDMFLDLPQPQRNNEFSVDHMKIMYKAANKAKVGDKIKCPYCKKKIIKTTYHKIFCSNRKTNGKENCKDYYWNAVRDTNPFDYR